MTTEKYVTEKFLQFAIDQFTETVRTHHDQDIEFLSQHIDAFQKALLQQFKMLEQTNNDLLRRIEALERKEKST